MKKDVVPAPTLEMLVGKKVSHVWFGDYSALYIELGELSLGKVRRNGTTGNPRGEITIYVGFDWRIEKAKSIVGGKNLSRKKRRSIIGGLPQRTIEKIEIVGRIPELQIQFSSSLWLITFNLSASQPDWSIGFNAMGLGHLCVNRGSLHVDRRNAKQTHCGEST